MLCDRVLEILKKNHLAKSKCAQQLGITHKTLGSYLKPEGQHNLLQYLPTFLEWYPRLSRQWLYFGEGPMFIGRGTPEGLPVPPLEILRVGEAMAADCGGSWGQVLRLIVDNAREELETDECANEMKIAPETQKELAEAKGEIMRLYKKLEGLQDEVINLQKELLAMHKEEKTVRAEGRTGQDAHTGQPAARS